MAEVRDSTSLQWQCRCGWMSAEVTHRDNINGDLGVITHCIKTGHRDGDIYGWSSTVVVAPV